MLDVEHLTISFADRHDGVDVVDDVSFSVRPGEVLGLIGESGCGKSLTSLAIMGLQPDDGAGVGPDPLRRQDLLALTTARRRRYLGHDMSMIYQDALSSLNPAMTIRAQLKQFTRRGGTRTPGGAARAGRTWIPSGRCGPTRTSCPAGSGSGCSSPWRCPATPG